LPASAPALSAPLVGRFVSHPARARSGPCGCIPAASRRRRFRTPFPPTPRSKSAKPLSKCIRRARLHVPLDASFYRLPPLR
jgi:hypothetical protein